VTALALMPTLKQRHQQDNSRLLVVKADEKVPYQLVIYTIDTARKVGLDQIALATRQPEPEKPTHVL